MALSPHLVTRGSNGEETCHYFQWILIVVRSQGAMVTDERRNRVWCRLMDYSGSKRISRDMHDCHYVLMVRTEPKTSHIHHIDVLSNYSPIITQAFSRIYPSHWAHWECSAFHSIFTPLFVWMGNGNKHVRQQSLELNESLLGESIHKTFIPTDSSFISIEVARIFQAGLPFLVVTHGGGQLLSSHTTEHCGWTRSHYDILLSNISIKQQHIIYDYTRNTLYIMVLYDIITVIHPHQKLIYEYSLPTFYRMIYHIKLTTYPQLIGCISITQMKVFWYNIMRPDVHQTITSIKVSPHCRGHKQSLP